MKVDDSEMMMAGSLDQETAVLFVGQMVTLTAMHLEILKAVKKVASWGSKMAPRTAADLEMMTAQCLAQKKAVQLGLVTEGSSDSA